MSHILNPCGFQRLQGININVQVMKLENIIIIIVSISNKYTAVFVDTVMFYLSSSTILAFHCIIEQLTFHVKS